jgi:hypothetical protein
LSHNYLSPKIKKTYLKSYISFDKKKVLGERPCEKYVAYFFNANASGYFVGPNTSIPPSRVHIVKVVSNNDLVVILLILLAVAIFKY